MGDRRIGITLLAVLTLGLFIGGVVLAQVAGPGSDADPLVSKSYVDKYLELKVVEIKQGQSLLAEGGTEIILRSGRAVAVTSPLGGLSDVTQGKDLKSDENIPANHLLIIPRSDGRGVRALSDIILLVRGGYEVK